MTTASHWRDDLWAAVDIAAAEACSGCGATTGVLAPALLDWRDRARSDRLARTVPRVECPGCGRPVDLSVPVCMLRPGDPLAVLASATDSASAAALEDVLAAAQDPATGRIAGPIACPPVAVLVALRAQYTGFFLAGLDDDLPELDKEAHDWLVGVRDTGDWSAPRTAVAALMGCSDEAAVDAAWREHEVLRDPAWRPVVRRECRELALGQPDPDAARKVRDLQRTWERLVLLGGADSDESQLPQSAQDALSAAALAGADPEAAAAAAAELRHAGQPVLLVASLIQRLAALMNSPLHDTRSWRALADAARDAADTASRLLGGDHPLTVRALSDAAAALLDARGPERPKILAEAEALHATATRAAAAAHDPALPGLLHNAAGLLIAAGVEARAPDQEAALQLALDAVHVRRLVQPDDPDDGTLWEGLGALWRGRLSGSPIANLRRADEAYRRAESTAPADRPAAAKAVLRGNRLNVAAGLHSLGAAARDEVLAAADRALAAAAALPPEHPVRLETQVNVAAAWLDAASSAPRDDALLAQADALLTDTLGRCSGLDDDDPLRLRASATKASAAAALADDPASDAAAEAALREVIADVGADAGLLGQQACDNLGLLLVRRADWDGAAAAYQQAATISEQLIATAGGADRLAYVAAADDVFACLSACHVQRGDVRSAVHVLERSRGRWLAERLGVVPDDDTIDRAVNACASGAALLYVASSGLGVSAAVMVGGAGAGAWTAAVGRQALRKVAAGLRGAFEPGGVSAALAEAARLLGPALVDNVLAIVDKHRPSELVVVASGLLSSLPLQALPGADGRCLLDAVPVRHLPSAVVGTRLAELAAERPLLPGATAAVVAEADDLRFGRAEVQALRRFDPATQEPPDPAGGRGWVLSRLPTTVLLHLSGHANHQPDRPLQSSFDFGRTRLTVADLAEAASDRLRLAVAAGCRSGHTGEADTDELVGIAHALLAAGAPGAVATLWDIDDLRTALLMARFYDELSRARQPAEALRTAQIALRDTTTRELADAADAAATGGQTWLPPLLAAEARALLLRPRNRAPEATPFRDPSGWASMAYVGA